jgi:3-demethoxyubiquinol 3-hydroxylase
MINSITTHTQHSMQPLAQIDSAPLTIYFDGSCPVCSREMAYYRRQVGADACLWVDASRCPEAALGTGLSRSAALGKFHVRDEHGELVQGVRGFAAMWRALPRTAWLGRVASFGPMPAMLDLAYAAFLAVRRVWHRPTSTWSRETLADLRSDHAGEVGAVQIYRGILATTRHAELRAFATHHLATERDHLRLIGSHLAAAHHSRLLPAWRLAGWLTGALPALLGPRMVYATVAAVESFVDRHYAEQIARLSALPADAARRALRDDLEGCRLDELRHRNDALAAGPASGPMVRCWTLLVGGGSAAAVALARRF